jgi:hypothetical protein
MVVVTDSKVARGSDAGSGGGGGGGGGGDCAFVTTILCAQDRHLKLAARPLILAGSIRYFFPHSSQMIIIQDILCIAFIV